MENKTNIIWICHFNNEFLRSVFKSDQNDFAPWINALLESYRPSFNINLTVIAPNIYTNRLCRFENKAVTYYLIPYKLPLISNRLNNLLGIEYFTNFFQVKYYVRRIIYELKPDLIHLHGAENPYYSASIIGLDERFKILVSVQGFFSESLLAKRDTFFTKKRLLIETLILSKAKYIGANSRYVEEIVNKINNSAKYFRYFEPVNLPNQVIDSCKNYDISFFARVFKGKGIEDLILAIEKCKPKRPEITLKVIGSCSPGYKRHLQGLIDKLKLKDNIEIVGFLPSQQEAFELVSKSLITVLPTYNDTMPGSIIECMFLKVPVISYATGGIPELNCEEKTVELVDIGNVDLLADRICFYLENPEVREKLSQNAYKFVAANFTLENIWGQINKAYLEIINVTTQNQNLI